MANTTRVKRLKVDRAGHRDAEEADSLDQNASIDDSETSEGSSEELEEDVDVDEEDEDDEIDEIEDDEFDVDSDSEPQARGAEKYKQAFSNAVSAILQSKVKAHDRDNPILVRSRKTAKDLESSKLDAKARRALSSQKRLAQDKDRVRNVLPDNEDTARQVLEHEKRLRGVAQRGVVRLFNAILASQNAAQSASQQKILGVTKKEEQVNDMSKDKFLELIRTGAKK